MKNVYAPDIKNPYTSQVRRNPYAFQSRRAAAVKRMNPVSCGLLAAAEEFEAARQAKVDADARFNRALAAFHASWARHGAAEVEA